jgi:hypothetical protein
MSDPIEPVLPAGPCPHCAGRTEAGPERVYWDRPQPHDSSFKTGGFEIMRCELTDHEWAAIGPMPPNKPRSPTTNEHSGAPCGALPDSFGPYTTS